MSNEGMAMYRLKKKYKNIKKNGLHDAVMATTKDVELRDMPGFVPDATLVYADGDRTVIRVFEIEDTNPMTLKKLSRIQRFANELYDESGVYLECFTTDEFGENEALVYDVRGDIAWGPSGDMKSELELAGVRPPIFQRYHSASQFEGENNDGVAGALARDG